MILTFAYFFLGGEGSVRLQLNRANKISDKFFLKVNIASEDGITKVITQPIKFMVIILCTDDQIIIKT